MFFRDVIGQEELKSRLIQTVREGHIAHAQLFCGLEGVGALPLALAYARYVHCTHPLDTDACGECPSCRKYNKLIHPDLHFVFPIIKADKKKKEVCDDYLPEWREFVLRNAYFAYNQWLGFMGSENSQGLIYAKESSEIIRKLSLKTYEAEYKIMIVWLPEKMHDVCSNKLLKMLEEPPQKTLFLLVAEQPELMLTTILSRSQRVNVRPIEPETLCRVLHERFGLTDQDASAVSHIAGGNYLKALETIQLTEENQIYFDYFTRYMRLAYTVANMKRADNPSLKFNALKELKEVADEISELGRERQKQFLGYCQRYLRENFVLNLRVPSLSYLNAKEAAFSSRFAPYIHHRNVFSFLEAFERAEVEIGQNVYAKMVFFDLALKAIMLLKN